MKKFWIRVLFFVAINAFIALAILLYSQRDCGYNNINSESFLFIIQADRYYDLLMLGASHGRVFSARNNHTAVEHALKKNFLNLSKTASGLLPEKLYLDYFYKKGNKAKQLIYILDPFVFYSDRWNERSYFLEDEPFKIDFFILAVRNALKKEVLLNYFRAKFTPFWVIGRKYQKVEPETEPLVDVDSEAVKKRINILYPAGNDQRSFSIRSRYFEILGSIITQAKQNGTAVTLIFPPTLLGDLPGRDEVKRQILDVLGKKYVFDFYDFSDVIKEPKYFMDHDHLNRNGVLFFTENFLKPILKD